MIADSARFEYEDENGYLVGCVERRDLPSGKTFVQYRYEDGKFVAGLAGQKLPLYRLADLRNRISRRQRVFIVEGETNAEDLLLALQKVNFGAAVTTLAGGANAKVTDDHLEQLRGVAQVVIIADSDAPGRACAARNAAAIATAHPSADVRIVDLFLDRDDGSDISDFLNEKGTLDQFRAAVADAERVTPVKLEDPKGLEWDDARPWPTLDEAALYGLAGEFVRIVAPHSEADLSALLAQFLAAFGCAIGPSAHVMVEATPHTGRINVLIVGDTAGGRKGTAKDQVVRVFRIADDSWLENAQISGLASGEGLIARLKDRDEGEPVEKRVLVIEPEFARTLAAGSRDGSILGAVIRDAWDTGRLQNLTRKEPLIAKGCHVGIIGQITADELRAKLSTTDIANGFVNRFLLACARRRQRLPHGGSLSDADLARIAGRLRTALDFGRSVQTVRRTAAANAAWERFYNGVPEPQGLLGAVTARAEAQVLRLSLLYALLDGSAVIDAPHLEAAEALWRYAHASAEHVFGATLGDDVADRVLEEIRAAYPAACERERLRAIFSRHISSARLTSAIDYLLRRGLAEVQRIKTDGRPKECVRATPRAKSVISAVSHPSAPISALSALSAPNRVGLSADGSGDIEARL